MSDQTDAGQNCARMVPAAASESLVRVAAAARQQAGMPVPISVFQDAGGADARAARRVEIRPR